MSYEKFVEFHGNHPDLDNTEYYAEFPDVNKSTIRSWKSRAIKPTEPEPTPSVQPLPSQQTADDNKGYEEQTDHYIQLMMTQTNSKASEFEGVDKLSMILVLKNKLKAQQGQTPSRASNSSILPSPNPIGQSTNKFGIDQYIDFNTDLNEILMEIPMSKLMNPEENKRIRKKRT